MLYLIGKAYYHTFLRLFSSHIVLLSIGLLATSILTWTLLPRLWKILPHDHGKALVPGGELSRGKPTGAGLILTLISLPVMALVVPPDWSICTVMATLIASMYFGFKDDASKVPWGQLKKGILDLLCAFVAAVCLCKGGETTIWLPFYKGTLAVSPLIYIPCATLLLMISTNAMNCSDGVDGLAGSLGLISLLSLSALLYLVLGYKPVADYLLLPHYPDSAKWAILGSTVAGAFGGYLWFNAEPSSVLMGDAGSRMLGLLIGVMVLATGNPLLILVFAPMILVNGGTGLVKILLLRLFKKLGFDTTPTSLLSPEKAAEQSVFIRGIHKVRFPLHDHCLKNLHWSRSQVLVRFMLIQSILIPFLFALFTKVR